MLSERDLAGSRFVLVIGRRRRRERSWRRRGTGSLLLGMLDFVFAGGAEHAAVDHVGDRPPTDRFAAPLAGFFTRPQHHFSLYFPFHFRKSPRMRFAIASCLAASRANSSVDAAVRSISVGGRPCEHIHSEQQRPRRVFLFNIGEHRIALGLYKFDMHRCRWGFVLPQHVRHLYPCFRKPCDDVQLSAHGLNHPSQRVYLKIVLR